MTDQPTPQSTQPPAAPAESVNWVKEEPQELRVFFFIGARPIQTNEIATTDDFFNKMFNVPKIERVVIWAFAFQLEDAAMLAKNKAPGFEISFTGQKPLLREFLMEGRIDDYKEYAKHTEAQPELKEALSPRQLSFEQFKAGILFFANENGVIFKNPADQETLRRIINEIQYQWKS